MGSATVRTVLQSAPKLGRELYSETGIGVFELWRMSHLEFKISVVGHRYLRFDRNVDGYARLSPAIEREFMTYTVVGLKEDGELIEARAKTLEREIGEISSRKMRLARSIVKRSVKDIGPEGICCIIGGDVPLGMAHDDLRPERSTGELVAGSDLDLVFIMSDTIPENVLKELDERLYKEKFSLLKNPRGKEELDYLVKRFSKVNEQMRFDSFERMVACKILSEGELLYGDEGLYNSIEGILTENSIPSKLGELERFAIERREKAEEYLLGKGSIDHDEYMRLFSTSAEFGEVY